MNRGALVSGTNGSGKTNLLELLLFDAAARGRPALLVDFKGSEALIDKAERLGGVVWAFDRPSPRWNPTQGNASEVAAKVTAVEGTQTGNQWNTVTAGYVQLAVRALLDAGVATDPAAIAALLNPPELERFLARPGAGRAAAPGAGAARCSTSWPWPPTRTPASTCAPWAGVASRMRGVLHGARADWLGQPDPGEPYLDVLEAIKAGRIVLFSINANRYGLPARRLGAWVLAEAMRVGASLGSAWGAANRCLFLIDEFSSLEEYGGAITKVLAVARENGVATFLFTQSLSRLADGAGRGRGGDGGRRPGQLQPQGRVPPPGAGRREGVEPAPGRLRPHRVRPGRRPGDGGADGERPAEAGGGALRHAARRGHAARLPRLRRAPRGHPPGARPAGPGGAPGAGGGACSRLGCGGGALAGDRRSPAPAPGAAAPARGPGRRSGNAAVLHPGSRGRSRVIPGPPLMFSIW